MLLLAVLAPVIWGDAADTYHTDALRQGPSGEHLAGTDSLGRDILLRVLVATRLSVGLALGATAIAVALGLLLGTLPAIAGRRVGRVVAAAIDVAVAFPALLLAIFFAVIFGVGEVGTMVALGVAGGPWFARLTLTLSATVAARDFVAAARVNGVGRGRILLRHVLPNIGEPLAINATLGAALNLLAFAGLSFLGIGVQAPSYDWGRLLNEGLNGIYVNPWAAIAPGVAIVLAGLAFNLTGELAAQLIGRRTRRRRRASRGSARRRRRRRTRAARARARRGRRRARAAARRARPVGPLPGRRPLGRAGARRRPAAAQRRVGRRRRRVGLGQEPHGAGDRAAAAGAGRGLLADG